VLEFQVLGPFQVIKEGRPLALGAYKQRALLALLLLERTRVVSKDRLVDALWGERPPPSAANSLQVLVSRLRRALANGPGEQEAVLLRKPPGYLLRVAAEAVDAERFDLLEQHHAIGAGRARRDAALVRRSRPRRGLRNRIRGPWPARAQGRTGRLEALRRPLSPGVSRFRAVVPGRFPARQVIVLS
jgi:Transcriptional regulatory protein, C terminal